MGFRYLYREGLIAKTDFDEIVKLWIICYSDLKRVIHGKTARKEEF